MAEHDPKCLAYGYGPGQRMDICICTGIRIGRADERERWASARDEDEAAAERMNEELDHLRATVAALINDPEARDGQEVATYILALLHKVPTL